MADDNMIHDTNRPIENGNEGENPEEMEEDNDITEVDFESLNLQLDELNSALDALEQKNDHIQAQLMELLQSNRETRQQFQEALTNEGKGQPQV